MSSELVNIGVHYGNIFINYCDSGVDLSQFQYVDTRRYICVQFVAHATCGSVKLDA